MSLLDEALEKYTRAEVPVTTDRAPTDAERPIQSVDALSGRLRESRDELRRAAGDDWPEVSGDSAKLIAFADLLAISQIRESGGIPDTYTATTECEHCGPVPIWRGCPPKVTACVWCLNGQSVPTSP